MKFKKLGDICEVIRGASPRPMGDPKFFKGDIPFLKIADITKVKGKYIFDSATKVNSLGANKSRYLKKGSLVLTNSASVCIPKFLGVDACIHDGFVSFQNFKEEYDQHFLYYYFDYIRPTVIQNNRQGITQVNLNTEIVRDFDIPGFSLPQQKAIVQKIEELFSELDKGVEQLETLQHQLKVYRQAVLKHAFEGKLTEEWRKLNPPNQTARELLAQIKAEREKQAKVHGKKFRAIAPLTRDELGQLPGLPGHWQWVKLEAIAEATDPQPSHRTPPIVSGGIPYIGIGEVDKETGSIDFENARKVSPEVLQEHINRYSISSDDFIIGKIGTIGKPFKVPTDRFYTLSANVVLVQPEGAFLAANYLFYLTQSSIIEDQFRAGSKATTQAAFGIKKVRTLLVPYCSMLEQKQIVQEIESRLSVCDKLGETIQESLKQADALRQSILKKAFSSGLVKENKQNN